MPCAQLTVLKEMCIRDSNQEMQSAAQSNRAQSSTESFLAHQTAGNELEKPNDGDSTDPDGDHGIDAIQSPGDEPTHHNRLERVSAQNWSCLLYTSRCV